MKLLAPIPIRAAFLAVCSLFLLPCSLYPQGTLTPPGAPAPTMKTLDQIEPRVAINNTNTPGDGTYAFVISSAGSYYLTGNLVADSTNGIHVTASGVTIDLNGFRISRLAGIVGVGIAIDSLLRNCVVKNGSVTGFSTGIDADGTRGGTLQQIAITDCTNLGMRSGDGWQIDGCKANDNSGTGIAAGADCNVSNCTGSNNGNIGIYAGPGSSLRNCTASSNTGTGIFAAVSCTLTNCAARQNSAGGITAGQGSVVSGCSASSNPVHGISAAEGCTISNCSVASNTNGGITASKGCVVTGCSVYFNPLHGISATEGCTISNCTVSNNFLDGIKASNGSLIRDNVCRFNGFGSSGAGIHVTSNHNRIEGNNCTGFGPGIVVDGLANVIIKNTCVSTSTDWIIVANNVIGPIIDLRAPASAAVNGFSAPDSTGSTHPNANFSY